MISNKIILSNVILSDMASLATAYGSYYEPTNSQSLKSSTQFDFGVNKYSPLTHEIFQEQHSYNDSEYTVGMRNVFVHDPVGRIFFSSDNIRRVQKQIKNAIYEKTNQKYKLEEDQDSSDLVVAMRAMYMEQGKYREESPVRQVKQLNKRVVDFVVPDMITEIKQYYGYLKDINEPLKPIDRPMNVCNAGRRTLPSITTTWTRN